MKTKILIILTAGALLTACGNSEKAGYAGMDLSHAAFIFRDDQTKAAVLRIDVSNVGKWALYSGLSVETIDRSHPVLEGDSSGEYALAVPDSVRSYFQLVAEKGSAILSERYLPVAGAYNFRDLGGHRTAEDRYVKWGKLFRSDDLYHLTEADLTYLASLSLVSVVDFRTESEVNRAPDKLPATVTGRYPYSISPGNFVSSTDLSALSTNEADSTMLDSLMMEMYVQLVTDSANIKRYRDYFALLQDEKNVPLLFHCSAGKDRTGVAAALTLFALGVEERPIVWDYLESFHFVSRKYRDQIAQHPALKPLFVVRPQYILASIQRIKQEYGSVENYLKEALHADIPKLKEMYLY